MKKSVFISHASRDKQIATEVCERLEQAGIGCWIAPRDIPPGMAYGQSIIEALQSCSVCLLVLSQNANLSQMVANEIERAANFEKTIIPLRIRNVQPAENLQLFVSSKQWVDAFAGPIADRIEYIAAVVQAAESNMPPPAPGPERIGFAAKAELWLEKVFRHKMVSAVAAVILLSAIGLSGLAMQSRTQTTVKEAAVEIKQAASQTVEAVTPTLRTEQSDEAMIGALRQGDVTTVRRLLTQGARATPQMAAGLVGELADKPDDLRRMLSAFRVATADRAEAGVKEISSILEQQFSLVFALQSREDSDDISKKIESLCSEMGSKSALGRLMGMKLSSRLECLQAFRSQKILELMPSRLSLLVDASRELSVSLKDVDNFYSILAGVFADVSYQRSKDSNLEFRSFVDANEVGSINAGDSKIYLVESDFLRYRPYSKIMTLFSSGSDVFEAKSDALPVYFEMVDKDSLSQNSFTESLNKCHADGRSVSEDEKNLLSLKSNDYLMKTDSKERERLSRACRSRLSFKRNRNFSHVHFYTIINWKFL